MFVDPSFVNAMHMKKDKEKKDLHYDFIEVLLIVETTSSFQSTNWASLCKLLLQVTNLVLFRTQPILTKNPIIIWTFSHSWLKYALDNIKCQSPLQVTSNSRQIDFYRKWSKNKDLTRQITKP